jgi:hypothetical protein
LGAASEAENSCAISRFQLSLCYLPFCGVLFFPSLVFCTHGSTAIMVLYMLAALVAIGAATKSPTRNEEAVNQPTSLNTGLLLLNVSLIGGFSQHFIAPPLPRNLRAGPRRLSWPMPNIFKRQNCQNGQNKCFADQNSWCSCEESCCESSTSSYCCTNSLCDLTNNLCAWPT